MNDNQSIIDKIIGDAKAIANENISVANRKAGDIIAVAKNKAAEMIESSKAAAIIEEKALIKRRLTVANIDAKKIVLSAKTTVIDSVINGSLTALTQLNDKEYLKIIEQIILNGAEDGDIVVISQNDTKRVTPAFFDKVATKSGKKIKLAKEYGEFSGGVYIQSANFDKNYTLESELKESRADMVAEIANRLFGG